MRNVYNNLGRTGPVLYLLQWVMHLCNMQCFPMPYQANLKIICMLILYSLSTLFPSAFPFFFTVANVLFKHRKSQTKLFAASGCTWLVKQRPLLLNSWLTHLCMRHMVDQKVLYNSYLHSRIWKIPPCQRSCEWGSGSTADLVRRICRNHGHKLKQNKTNKDLDLHRILSLSFFLFLSHEVHISVNI